jgi:hypothetical protein
MFDWLSNLYFRWHRYGGSVERMTPDEFEMGKEWLNETYHLIRLVILIAFVFIARVMLQCNMCLICLIT